MPTIEQLISEIKALRGELRVLQTSQTELAQRIHDQGVEGELRASQTSQTQLAQRIHDQGVEINARGRLTDEFIEKLYASDTKFSELQPYFPHLLLIT